MIMINKNKKSNKINFFKDIWTGIKFGVKMASLPQSVNKFHNNPLTRIFRVLGGLSILLLLSGSELIKQSIFFYIVIPLAFLQFTYIIVINLIKFFYVIHLWRNNKFQVRNSPLNKLATFAANLVACVKGTCVLGLSGGTALGMGLGIDELLANYGRETIFRDTLGNVLDKGLNNIGIKNTNKDITKVEDNLKVLKYRYNQLKSLSNNIDELESISQEAGMDDSEFINEVKKDLKKQIEVEKHLIAKSKSNILSQLDVKNSFSK